MKDSKFNFDHALSMIIVLVWGLVMMPNISTTALATTNAIFNGLNRMVVVSGSNIWTDFGRSGSYNQFLVKGVGYAPVPVGHFMGSGNGWSADCWYQGLNPPNYMNLRFTTNSLDSVNGYACGNNYTNFYQTDAIFDRDFSLLKAMGTNVIRTWDAITSKLLQRANQYGLKVIAGYWVDHAIDYTFPGTAGATQRQNLINGFVNYINTYKNDPNASAILMWGLSNENNADFCNACYNHAKVSCIRAAQATGYYNLMNDMALAARTAEGTGSYHPVMIVSAELTNDLISYGKNMPYVDVIGINSYRGMNFDGYPAGQPSLFDQFRQNFPSKALIITEFGIDAWNSGNTTNPDLGFEDQTSQANYDASAWKDIVNHSVFAGGPASGGVVFDYADSFNKYAPAKADACAWASSDWTPSVITHDHEAIPANFASQDQKENPEWWGIVDQEHLTSGKPTPRAAYTSLQTEFAGDYFLLVNAQNGTVTKSLIKSLYTAGTSVTLTAQPASGYTFAGWSGDLTGLTNPTSISMTSHKAITANFKDVTPATGTVLINGTAAYTNTLAVTLTLDDLGSGATTMRVRNQGAIWPAAEPYVKSKPWILSTGDGTKTVYVSYYDAAGNIPVDVSDSIILDITLPGIPGTPMISVGKNPTNTGIYTLAWTAATDNVGIKGYKVFRKLNAGAYAQIAQTTTASYSETALPQGQYAYQIYSVDTSDNVSLLASGGLTVVVDTTLPGIPGTPKISVGMNPTNTGTYTLTWTAATDNVGIKGYKVYRKLNAGAYAQVAQTTTASYSETALPQGQYAYQIYSVDAANNVSLLPSGVLTVVVDKTPPTITGISASVASFNPEAGQNVAFSYTISDNVSTGLTTQLTIDKSTGVTIKTKTLTGLSSGANSISWGGYNDSGSYVADGVYRWTIQVTDPAGNSAVSRSYYVTKT